jgi:hypothetical protein
MKRESKVLPTGTDATMNETRAQYPGKHGPMEVHIRKSEREDNERSGGGGHER